VSEPATKWANVDENQALPFRPSHGTTSEVLNKLLAFPFPPVTPGLRAPINYSRNHKKNQQPARWAFWYVADGLGGLPYDSGGGG